MTTIKLLHTADIHLGMENYGRIDPATGVNGRVMDFLRRLSDLADFAIEQQVDIVVFAGDAYRTRDPNPTYQREFARRIKKMADAGIPVLLLVGNHDIPTTHRRATSISIFDTLEVPNVHVADREGLREITCRRGQRLLVATVPYPLRSALLAREEYRGKTVAELDQALTQLMIGAVTGLAEQARDQADVPAILAGHFTVNEASLGSERSIMIGRDVGLPRSVLADPVWRYVALGHIHRHQSLNQEAQPPIVYSGSIERIDFGEEQEPKGFVLAEIGDGPTGWQFVTGYRVEARPFVTVRADAREAQDPTGAVLQAIANRHDLAGAVVRLLVRLRQEQEPLLIERELVHALEPAYFVAPVQKEVDRANRQRLGDNLVETLTPLELLERYFIGKGVAPERLAALLGQARQLIAAGQDGEAGRR